MQAVFGTAVRACSTSAAPRKSFDAADATEYRLDSVVAFALAIPTALAARRFSRISVPAFAGRSVLPLAVIAAGVRVRRTRA
ncbi:MAG: hypothetical protein KDI72_06980 [Xanthomonadales bacterium]|nr:hypothetical protein [Xanthomonadales bacterium]